MERGGNGRFRSLPQSEADMVDFAISSLELEVVSADRSDAANSIQDDKVRSTCLLKAGAVVVGMPHSTFLVSKD